MIRLTAFASLDEAEAANTSSGRFLDVPHPHEQSRRRFGRRTAFGAEAFVWSDGPLGSGGPSFVLEEHIGWIAPDAAVADPADVVKQISFLAKSDSVDLAGFRASYRHHVEVARRHMHTLWQYVQYDVVAIDGERTDLANDIISVSVLWFKSTDDFCNRYFASAQDQAEFQAQEGFLDLPKAFSFVLTSHPSAIATARIEA